MGWNDRNPELYDALYAGGYLSGPYAGINPERFDVDESCVVNGCADPSDACDCENCA